MSVYALLHDYFCYLPSMTVLEIFLLTCCSRTTWHSQRWYVWLFNTNKTVWHSVYCTWVSAGVYIR